MVIYGNFTTFPVGHLVRSYLGQTESIQFKVDSVLCPYRQKEQCETPISTEGRVIDE